MAKVAVYNVAGDKTKDIELNDAIFNVTPKNTLIHQVYVALRANARQPWAHVKDRSEVRGGGRKPWKQKGTGRARHGSNRSPIWSGGGVTFGPLNTRNYAQKINKKMKIQAVKMCLSDKVIGEKLNVLEKTNFDGKTKNIDACLTKIPGMGKTRLLITDTQDDVLLRAARNIEKFDIVRAQDVNVVDLMHHQYIMLSEDAVSALEKRFVK